MAPWVAHTHIDCNVCEGPLEEKLRNLWNAGYQGYYSVERHSGRNEYVEVATQLARVRGMLDQLRGR